MDLHRFPTLLPLTLLVAVSLLSPLRAQTSSDWKQLDELKATYYRHLEGGQLAEMERAAERMAAFVKERFTERDQFRGLCFLAEARLYRARYQESIDIHRALLEQYKSYTPRDKEELADLVWFKSASLRGLAINMNRLGRYEEAIPYCEENLRWSAEVKVYGSDAYLVEAHKDLAYAYMEIGETGKAEREFREVIAAAEQIINSKKYPGNEMVAVLAQSLSGLGGIESDTGRFDLAEPHLRRALQLMVSVYGWDHANTAPVLDTLGNLYYSQRRWADAAPYYKAAVDAWDASSGKGHPESFGPMTNWARAIEHLGRSDETLALMRQALAICEKHYGHEHIFTSQAMASLGATLTYRGEFKEADKLLRETLAMQEKFLGPSNAQVAMTLFDLVMLEQRRGDYAASLPLLDRMEKIFEIQPRGDNNVAGLRVKRATALWVVGRKNEAVAEMLRALDRIDAEQGYASGAERERSAMFEVTVEAFDTLIDWQAELGNASELFQIIERKKARSFLDEMRLQNIDVLAGMPPAERQKLRAREAELRLELSKAESQLQNLPAAGKNPSPEHLAKIDDAVKRVSHARDALYQWLADIRAASPAYRELIVERDKPVTLVAIQEHLADDELVLSYTVSPTSAFVLVIRRQSAKIVRLETAEAAAKALGVSSGPLGGEQLTQTLMSKDQGLLQQLSSPGASAALTPRLAALWKTLIPAAERELLITGKLKRLTILPDGPLALLPFEALVVTSGEDPEYLLDVGPPIVYAPSATVMSNLQGRGKTKDVASRRVLTLGDPSYTPSGAQSASVERKLGVNRAANQFRSGLARLPYTGWEATWIQQMFEKAGLQCTKLAGVQATEAAFRQQVAGREIVHLACHGLADQSYGNLFGALALAPGRSGDSRDDGFLSMSEIYELDLKSCELAILSACETNYGPQQSGEGVWALSRGFLVAGARRVIASNWVVDDQAGATLVSYFANYATRAGADSSGRDFAQALHAAKQQVRKEAKWSHPFYWSSLVLVGPN